MMQAWSDYLDELKDLALARKPKRAKASHALPVIDHEAANSVPLAMFKGIAKSFESNCAAVDRLINFDRDVLDLVIMHLDGLHQELKKRHASEQLNGGRV